MPAKEVKRLQAARPVSCEQCRAPILNESTVPSSGRTSTACPALASLQCEGRWFGAEVPEQCCSHWGHPHPCGLTIYIASQEQHWSPGGISHPEMLPYGPKVTPCRDAALFLHHPSAFSPSRRMAEAHKMMRELNTRQQPQEQCFAPCPLVRPSEQMAFQ